jgi:hypothetical protein
MFLMLAAILMVGIGLCAPCDSFSPHRIGRRRQGLQWLAFAIALGLASIPTSAWANALGETSAQILRARPEAPASPATEARVPQGQDYASREASAKGLEKFEGGSTTVIWVAGGSTLVVVLIVVLIIVII